MTTLSNGNRHIGIIVTVGAASVVFPCPSRFRSDLRSAITIGNFIAYLICQSVADPPPVILDLIAFESASGLAAEVIGESAVLSAGDW